MALEKKRILFVIKNLQQGGTERQVLRMMRSIDLDRYEVALCTLAPEIHYGDLPFGEPRYAFSAKGREAVRVLREVMEDFRPHVVHSFRDLVNRWVWRALRGLAFRPTWLMSVRGRPVLPLDLLWASVMHRRAFRVAVNSRGIAATLKRFTSIPRQQIAIVPNLIDESAFAPVGAVRRAAARAELGLPPEAFVWVLPGRISWVKNQLGLLAALWLMKRAGTLPPGAVVILAGRRRDPLPSALVPRLIRLLGLAAHVRLLEAVKSPTGLYAAADALVLPSIAEGRPNVTLEAQLSALPVVATWEANRDFLVVDGENGLVAPSPSPWALASAMARMMALPAFRRQQMGRRGRSNLLRDLSSNAIAEKLDALYDAAAADADGVATSSARTAAM
jgi:glycosyltransferase involved in cell wall biosynthesis